LWPPCVVASHCLLQQSGCRRVLYMKGDFGLLYMK
jgi:hypothetical protein